MFNIKLNSKERKAVGISASLVSLFGMWSVEEEDASLRIRWIISTLCMAVLLIQGSYESYLNCVRLDHSADNLYSITFGISGLSKVLFYYMHRQKLRVNVDAIVEDWSSKDEKNYDCIMRNCKNNSDKFTRYFLTIGVFMSLMYVTKIFFIDPDVTISIRSMESDRDGNSTMILKKRFLLPAACVFNDASQISYWIIFVAQLFQSVISFGVNLCSDIFFTAIAGHLCAQFEILKIKFARFTKSNNAKETRENFRILIVRHRQLLELSHNLETAFTMIVFVQMVTNVFTLNVAGFNVLILLKKKESVGALTNATVILFSIVQTFMYSYIGDRLTSQGDEIGLSVYNCEWYSMPKNFSKDMICVIERTRFPIGLTAGKFFKMTRSTFTDIVKTAASYLSVLRIMIEDDV